MRKLINHQPHYLPSVQYFARMRDADVFVYADDVQFCKQDWQNRNKVLTSQGVQWLIVPVEQHAEELIRDKRIALQKDFRRQHAAMIRNAYGRSPGWKSLSELVDLLMSRKWERLVDLSRATLEWFVRFLDIRTDIRWASSLGLEEVDPSCRLASQCRLLGCDTYVHGKGASNYLDPTPFAGIRLLEHSWTPAEYAQMWNEGKFVANLSVVDLIANTDKDASNFLGMGLNGRQDDRKETG